MNMINVRRLTVMTFLGAGMLSGISAQVSPLQVDTLKETKIPAQWDLQSCIDYAKEQNITIRKNRITAASTQIDVKTAKAALFPSLSFSTSQQVVNRPYQETSSRVSGSEIISSNSKTSYNGNYGNTSGVQKFLSAVTLRNRDLQGTFVYFDRLGCIKNLDIHLGDRFLNVIFGSRYVQFGYLIVQLFLLDGFQSFITII